MNVTIDSEYMRVTSINFMSSKFVIFSGVPLKKNSYKINSGKYYITIQTDIESIPVKPSVGQHWSVKGVRRIESSKIDDYLMRQHIYSSPQYIECTLPDSGEQLIRFIAQESDFKGIGESKARALWSLLGKKFHTTLSHDTPSSRKLLRTVLTEESINALYRGYSKYKNLQHCNWMSKHSIPASVQQRLLRYHGESSVNAIKENPFLLVGFGMPFESVDLIAETFSSEGNIIIDDPRRLSAALEFSIQKEVSKGHTYTTHASLRPHLKKLLKSEMLVAETFKSGHSKAQYILNPSTGGYHPTAQFLMENVVAKRLLALTRITSLYDKKARAALTNALADLPYELTSKQLEAVKVCLDNAVSCVTGGAGTGKTTVLRTVLRSYHQMGYEIHAVALSGRASMRLHESIGFFTSTIAKFLRGQPVHPSETQKRHLLIIDESSMLDLPTVYRLITHIHPSVRIIFTGDPDQLPPIGCGKVLSDIVLSKTIVNTVLDIVKRQEGSTGIPEYSRQINQGNLPNELSTGTIHFHETSKSEMAQLCCELYQQSPDNSRVIAPTKTLVAEINKLTQKRLNDSGNRLEFIMHGEHLFMDLRLNDPILFTKNHYEEGIQNGSLGELSNVQSSNDSYGEVTLDTGEIIKISQTVLDCMELGYAITLHKAQGSQFPRVIIALQGSRLVDRAWIYTAITRAEIEIHIVGSLNDFKRIVQAPSNSNKRNSFLKDLLVSGYGQEES